MGFFIIFFEIDIHKYPSNMGFLKFLASLQDFIF